MTKEWSEERQCEILRKIGIIEGWGELETTEFKLCPLGLVGSCNDWNKHPCKGCTLSEFRIKRD